MIVADATLLIVDDEPELLEIFAIWMGRTGAKVLTAPNGAEALRILEGGGVDALISDVRMPVMDGVTLVRRLYEQRIQVPSIIFVSGFGELSAREMYSFGVEAMLAKPLARGELLKALGQSLLARETCWTELQALENGEPGEAITLTFHSADEAMRTHHFELGRGGCCVRTDQPMREGQLRFSIAFREEGVTLAGVGTVRWIDRKDSMAGIEFEYLEPECRRWITDRMHGEMLLSFIPKG